VLELEALLALDQAARLSEHEQDRLAALLELRAADFHARGRAIPESHDLRLLEQLAPGRAEALSGRRAFAERSAGDDWLAIGALAEASEAYRRGAALGAPHMVFRQRAAAGEPTPPSAPLAEMEEAIATLPLRGIPPVALAYITRGGSDHATLLRGLEAARQERTPALIARLRVALAEPPEAPVPDAPPPVVALSPPPASAPLPADLDEWLLAGPTLSARLLPITVTHPELLDDPRAVRWVDLLLAEDPTSTEVLELAATVFGHARRFGGTDRMLMELAYHSPDRAAGLSRGAEIWQGLGRPREACAQWIRAARWRDDAEDPTWRRAIACTRQDPGAGDWHAIRKYVIDLAAPERREAIAAALDRP
jgi:hypothetical protein